MSVIKSAHEFGSRPDWYRDVVVPEGGDYYGSTESLWLGQLFVTHDRRNIVHRNERGAISVSKNVCLHAGAQLIREPGEKSVESIRCPIHQWLYKPDGHLVATPGLKVPCEKMRLQQVPFGIWNGYVIGYSQEELDSALSGFGKKLGLPLEAFNPEAFVYLGEEVDDVPYPNPLMMINYLDGYHVPLYHQKTFSLVADCGTYEWELSPLHENHQFGYSIQQVRSRKDVEREFHRMVNRHDGSPEQFGWADLHFWIHRHLLGLPTPIDPDIFAVWGAIYGKGHLMIELYEGGLFLAVSSLVNVDPQNLDTGNKNPVEFYLHKSIPLDLRPEAGRKFISAYKQSADEDTELCKTLWEAHKLGSIGFDRVYHSTLERGGKHFEDHGRKHWTPRK